MSTVLPGGMVERGKQTAWPRRPLSVWLLRVEAGQIKDALELMMAHISYNSNIINTRVIVLGYRVAH